jgi:hypothetical protein
VTSFVPIEEHDNAALKPDAGLVLPRVGAQRIRARRRRAARRRARSEFLKARRRATPAQALDVLTDIVNRALAF